MHLILIFTKFFFNQETNASITKTVLALVYVFGVDRNKMNDANNFKIWQTEIYKLFEALCGCGSRHWWPIELSQT